MRDYSTSKRTAIRYWERRRIIYNLALIPPALVSYAFADTMNWVGDPHPTLYSFLLLSFALSAIGANICYTFAYVLEYFFASNNPISPWLRFGRTTAFVGGILLSMLLAFIGGAHIANMEYYEQFRHPPNSLSAYSCPHLFAFSSLSAFLCDSAV
jgi:hypothetical protein